MASQKPIPEVGHGKRVAAEPHHVDRATLAREGQRRRRRGATHAERHDLAEMSELIERHRQVRARPATKP
jgi:hypothetical protein